MISESWYKRRIRADPEPRIAPHFRTTIVFFNGLCRLAVVFAGQIGPVAILDSACYLTPQLFDRRYQRLIVRVFSISNGAYLEMSYAQRHMSESVQIAELLDCEAMERMVDLIAQVRDGGGRLFFLGVGGSAANCSHAVNDFRKIAGIECYAPTDNVSELTARTNDDGWASVFVEWLKVSRLNAKDAVFVMSVGGGNLEKNVSPNLVSALQHAKQVGAKITGIVSRDGGYTAQVGDVVVIVPVVNAENTTPHAEAFQAVVWHLLASHPKIKVAQTKWESVR